MVPARGKVDDNFLTHIWVVGRRTFQFYLFEPTFDSQVQRQERVGTCSSKFGRKLVWWKKAIYHFKGGLLIKGEL